MHNVYKAFCLLQFLLQYNNLKTFVMFNQFPLYKFNINFAVHQVHTLIVNKEKID